MTHWLWSIAPEHFAAYVRTGTFALRRQGRRALAEVRPGDRIFAYLPGSRVLAGLFEATGAPFEDATPLVRGAHHPHRVRVRPVVALSQDAWMPFEAFAPKLTALVGEDEPNVRFRSLMQRVLVPLPSLDGKVLEFLVRARSGADPEAVVAAYERYRAALDGVEERDEEPVATEAADVREAPASYAPSADAPFDRAEPLEQLIAALDARGFVYAPWQLATYVTALRTKPLVLLAGVTGVGKSRLPVLVAEATGGVARLLPVRPDWTDPADVLGHTDLAGAFRPGALLAFARDAMEDAGRHYALVLDEMNLARPEHYLAEVLSRIEERRPASGGGFQSPPLLAVPGAADAGWRAVGLPPNLALVGTVNVDESTHPLGRKVLDRAFVLELGASDLGRWEGDETNAPGAIETWPADAWRPRATRLAELGQLTSAERATVEAAVEAVAAADGHLGPAGLGLGYRARDEAALFCLHARDTPAAWRTRDGEPVDPLDVALLAKVLPRVEGSRRAVREGVLGLLGWAADGRPRRDEADAADLLDGWDVAGRPEGLADAWFPRTAARLARMADALLADGYASFWS